MRFNRVRRIMRRRTLAPILKKEDGLVDFSRTAGEILNRMRGFQPWPGAYTKFRGKTMQIWLASACKRSLPISELRVEGDHVFVGCGEHTAMEILGTSTGRQEARLGRRLLARLSSSIGREAGLNWRIHSSCAPLIPSYWR